MRKNIVAGNWKLNNTMDEGLKLSSEIANMVADELRDDVSVVLGTPYIHLSAVSKLTETTDKLNVAAQDCSIHESGAYTGEISVSMIQSTGAKYVVIGHSERREYHNETNAELATKVNLALKASLTPIFCCGESLDIRESGKHESFVSEQITKSLFHLTEEQMSKVVVAYEPIWAIGTGVTASSEQAQEMHKALRAHIASKFGNTIADETSILYGGSCKPTNANELFSQADIDGGLIGGASLNARDFMDIIKSF
ncbi:MAG: triose-phosphate isomerase [Cyclobacteriaceae bacterium]|nr:triose-phosphate isomerase [Cyclobacteriaceae bacterium]